MPYELRCALSSRGTCVQTGPADNREPFLKPRVPGPWAWAGLGWAASLPCARVQEAMPAPEPIGSGPSGRTHDVTRTVHWKNNYFHMVADPDVSPAAGVLAGTQVRPLDIFGSCSLNQAPSSDSLFWPLRAHVLMCACLCTCACTHTRNLILKLTK